MGFKEWLLTEMPVAVLDDRETKVSREVLIGKKAFDNNLWVLQGKYKNNLDLVEVYKSSTTNKYISGVWAHQEKHGESKPVFVVITDVTPLPFDALGNFLEYSNPIQMTKLTTGEDFRNQGYASSLYMWFLSKGFTIISDMVQFNGARKLYSGLSKDPDLVADVIDVEEHKLIKHDVSIEQPYEDWDIDTSVYSLNFDKAHIRIAIYVK